MLLELKLLGERRWKGGKFVFLPLGDLFVEIERSARSANGDCRDFRNKERSKPAVMVHRIGMQCVAGLIANRGGLVRRETRERDRR